METVTFPIDELVRRVGRVLTEAGVRQRNGQVSATPTERTLRYYRTCGLLDPPAGQRGRTALYGSRHVLQVLAIKHLQAAGMPLEEIQQRLVGRSDTHLAAVAGVDPAVVTAGGPAAAPARAFWAERPAGVAVNAASRAATTLLAGIELDGAVHLTFPARRALSDADRDALATAAREVVACLRTRRLLPAPEDVPDDAASAPAVAGDERTMP